MIIVTPKAAQKAKFITDQEQSLVKDWLDFCRDKTTRKAAILVDFENGRSIGRWGYEERKRKFVVRHALTLDVLSTSTTLQNAIRLAEKILETRKSWKK
jgi:hypothetical protein